MVSSVLAWAGDTSGCRHLNMSYTGVKRLSVGFSSVAGSEQKFHGELMLRKRVGKSPKLCVMGKLRTVTTGPEPYGLGGCVSVVPEAPFPAHIRTGGCSTASHRAARAPSGCRCWRR